MIDSFVQDTDPPLRPLDSFLQKKMGVFVTLHTYPSRQLRGCIGIPEPVLSLWESLEEAAISATQDPRFPSLKKQELGSVIVEVTALTPPELIHVVNPKEYLKKIIIGKHGLIIRKNGYSGLLLPQVPIEQGWDVQEFLVQTCHKAWLPADSWLDPQVKLYTFSGQVFTEMEPKGTIKEKALA
jgi:uncharacterized protein (TIGR00296 family)